MPSPRPSWSQRLRRVCVYLVLGLVTTVGVAWGLSFWSPVSEVALSSRTYSPTPGSPAACNPNETLTISYQYGFGSMRRSWVTPSRVFGSFFLEGDPFALYPPVDERDDGDAILFAWSLGGARIWGRLPAAVREYSDSQPHVGVHGFDTAHGWPALALWHDQTSQTALLAGQSAGPFAGEEGVLPYRPIWPGLAFNTAFYALLWWLGFSSVGIVKQIRRYRRGLCPVCRYDLRSDYSGGCSECGWGR